MELLINELIKNYNMQPLDINGCYCYGFAEDLSNLLYKKGLDSEILCNEHFFNIDNEDTVTGWNVKQFTKCNLSVPKSNAKEFDFYHVFLFHNNLFYDAETINGVTNWLDLPFFQRVLQVNTM